MKLPTVHTDSAGSAAVDEGDLDSLVQKQANSESLIGDTESAFSGNMSQRESGKKPPINKLTFILTVLLAIAVVIIVRQAGMEAPRGSSQMPANHPDISQMQQEVPKLDEAKVAELQAKLAAQPDDLSSLKELGKVYFDGRDYQKASDTLKKALAIASSDFEVQLMLGVSEYSMNRYDEAERHWIAATELDPSKAEPWYNLGYVYLMREPVDTAKLTAAWDKVVQLAPESDMAKDIKTYRENENHRQGK